MKVIAKHWVNYNGVWHGAGQSFDVDDIEPVKDFVVPDQYVSAIFPPEKIKPETPITPPVRRKPKKVE